MTGLLGNIKNFANSPAIQGIGGALAFGANPLVGLLAAPGIKNDRERRELENATLRQGLLDRQKQSRAEEELAKLFSSTAAQPSQIGLLGLDGNLDESIPVERRVPAMQTQDGQNKALGLLAQIQPETVAGLLSPQQQRAEPAFIRELRALDDPTLSNDQKELLRAKLENGSRNDPAGLEQAIQTLTLQARTFELRNAQAEANEKRAQGLRGTRELETSINASLKDAESLLNLNDSLEGTFLQPGQVFAGERRGVAAAFNELRGAFGSDTSGTQDDLDNFDKFRKTAANLGIDALANLNNFGTLTNEKLRTFQESIAGIGVNPAANRLIIADYIDGILDQALIDGVQIDGIDRLRSLADSVRSKPSQKANQSDAAEIVEDVSEAAESASRIINFEDLPQR